jgi:hypothetical protein
MLPDSTPKMLSTLASIALFAYTTRLGTVAAIDESLYTVRIFPSFTGFHTRDSAFFFFFFFVTKEVKKGRSRVRFGSKRQYRRGERMIWIA